MRPIKTHIGTIYVQVQGDDALYMQAGYGTYLSVAGSSAPSAAASDVENLNVRGVPLSLNGHLRLVNSEWTCNRSYLTVRRRDTGRYGQIGGRDATRAMEDAVVEAMTLAAAQVTPAELEQAQRTRCETEAAERDKTIAELLAQVKALKAEARALRAGGRTEYHEHRLNGMHDELRHVRTRGGRLLPTLPEVRVYGTDRYGPRLPENVR